jgi:TPR repeat protein
MTAPPRRGHADAAPADTMAVDATEALAQAATLDPDAGLASRLAQVRARAEAGDLKAMFELGWMHDLPPKPGLPHDLAIARQWYERAAEGGFGWAQFALGHMLERADGGVRNHLGARRWYEAAAKQHLPEAQMHYARMLDTGRGGPADPVQAAWWYEQAATQGHEKAATLLALMHRQGRAPQPDLAKARELLEFAADKLDGDAHLMLADGWLHGLGSERHGGLALVHYCVAILLLSPGPSRDRAETAKAALLAQRPDLRDEYEGRAQAFVDSRRPGGAPTDRVPTPEAPTAH